MPKTAALKNRIFNVDDFNEYNDIALEIFHFQYQNNSIYRQFVDFLKIPIRQIHHFSNIPFMPIEFFKRHNIVSGEFIPDTFFTSSGTTGKQTSKHLVTDIKLYENSFLKAFNLFFGDVSDYIVIALLPSYLERQGSSLVYMANRLISESDKQESGFYLNEYEELHSILHTLKDKNQKVILLGVTYALLDLAELFPMEFPNLILMETGGMKGKRRELIRDELHSKLKKAFGIKNVYSEYGMTELLSQAYSKGDGLFNCPPWMKVIIRDVNDPISILPKGKAGGINVIDFANLYSCSFIATQDLGKVNEEGSFEIIGRYDNSDVRGCNLLVN